MDRTNSMTGNAPPEVVSAIELWVAKIVAIFAGIWAIWKGFRFSLRKLKDVWRTLTAFADAINVLEQQSAEIAGVKARMAVLVELSANPFWQADTKGRCVDANTAFLKLFGLSRSEALGLGWQVVIHPEDAGVVTHGWEDAIEEGGQFNRTFRIRSGAETLRVTMRAFPALNLRGEVVEYHGTATVISRKPITKENA